LLGTKSSSKTKKGSKGAHYIQIRMIIKTIKI